MIHYIFTKNKYIPYFVTKLLFYPQENEKQEASKLQN